LENVVEGFVNALTARATKADAAAAGATTTAATSISNTAEPKIKRESGWDLIRKLVKLLLTKGNQYGYAVGVRYQEWCRWHGKRDALKGLTRVVGVRPDARARNAKPILQACQHGLDAFFDWLAVQKDQDNKEKKANGLERSVRNACCDPRTVSELWATAVFSDGLFQPMMMAINESDTHKSMMSLRSVAQCIRHHLRQWSEGRAMAGLLFGWMNETTMSAETVICAAASYITDRDQRSLSSVSRGTVWNLRKRSNTTTPELSQLATHVLAKFEHFIEEYLPNGALNQPIATVRAVAAVSPPNNDAVERLFGVYDHFNSKVAVNMMERNKEGRIVSRVNHTVEWWTKQEPETQERALHAARAYALKSKSVWNDRRRRDEELRRLRAAAVQATNAKKHTNRAIRQQRKAEVELWTSSGDLTLALQNITGKTARWQALRAQLSAYKQRHKVSDIRLSVNGTQLTEDELTAKLLTVIEQYGRAAAAASSSGSSASASASSSSSSSATAASNSSVPPPARTARQPRSSKPRPKKMSTATSQASSTPSAAPPTAHTQPATRATMSRRQVLQCCNAVDTSGEYCVQCESCKEWYHCSCEQVAWEAVNSMETYLCRACMGEAVC
jgi:hypothetical protein